MTEFEKHRETKDEAAALCARHYDENVRPITGPVFNDIHCYLLEKLTPEVIIHAMDVAIDKNSANWRYICGILNNYRDKRLYTMERVLADEQQFKERFKTDKTAKKSRFNNFDEDGDMDDYEKKSMEKRMKGGK